MLSTVVNKHGQHVLLLFVFNCGPEHRTRNRSFEGTTTAARAQDPSKAIFFFLLLHSVSLAARCTQRHAEFIFKPDPLSAVHIFICLRIFGRVPLQPQHLHFQPRSSPRLLPAAVAVLAGSLWSAVQKREVSGMETRKSRIRERDGNTGSRGSPSVAVHGNEGHPPQRAVLGSQRRPAARCYRGVF